MIPEPMAVCNCGMIQLFISSFLPSLEPWCASAQLQPLPRFLIPARRTQYCVSISLSIFAVMRLQLLLVPLPSPSTQSFAAAEWYTLLSLMEEIRCPILVPFFFKTKSCSQKPPSLNSNRIRNCLFCCSSL